MKDTTRTKRRTYDYYYIVRNLNDEDPEFIEHSETLEGARIMLSAFLPSLDPGDTLYIVHMNVVEKWEAREVDD